MTLAKAVEKGVWFLLHDNSSLNEVLNHISLFFNRVLSKTGTTRDDIFGEADDVELKDDARLLCIETNLNDALSADLWEKQYIVLYSLWQFPGLLEMVASNSSQPVAYFLNSNFKDVMAQCMYGTAITPDKKGAKTVIVAHALSPLETVCYVVKLLQLTHYHNLNDER